MRTSLAAATALLAQVLLAQAPTESAAPTTNVRVELNNIQTAENRCDLTFVIENKAKTPMQSLQLDLAVFNPQGIVQRRLATEMGPLRASKTIVKTFAVDGACGEVGSILVNDVTCKPGTPDACLSGLELSSRLKNVRLYK
jgi:hypothetical protein